MRGLPEDEELSTPPGAERKRSLMPLLLPVAALLSRAPSDLWRPSATTPLEVGIGVTSRPELPLLCYAEAEARGAV